MPSDVKEMLLEGRVEITRAIGTATDNYTPFNRDRSTRVLMVALQLARRMSFKRRSTRRRGTGAVAL
jgi:hypothetical protein